MENELTYTAIADNSLLEFGETRMPLGDDNRSELYDITAVFEDGWSFGESTIASVELSTNGSLDIYGPAGFRQGRIEVMDTDLETSPRLELDEDAGVYFDTNEERDSVVVTWNKVAFYNWSEGPRQTFQLEIIDRGEGDSELVFRWADTDGNNYYSARLNPFYGSAELNTVLDIDQRDTPLADLDTRIGNTGIAGVEQILLRDGEPFGVTLTGTEEADVLAGGPLGDLIDGLGGNDTITGGGGSDTITGGDGDDEITAPSNTARYYYEETSSGAVIDGGLGDDTIRTGDRDDTITGGEGDDLINGGFGSDDLSGGAGDDIIRFGHAGATTVSGGNGDDYIDGSFLDDDDSGYYYYYNNNISEIDAGAGNDTILGTRNADMISGQDGNDSVLAGGGRDIIFGGEGDDILTGGQGDDSIEGGAGDDFIFGALGRDTATGGDGADRFYASGRSNDQMRILDYNYDEGDFLVLDGDEIERDAVELLYTTALTADGLESRDYRIGIRSEDGFQQMFSFGNEAEIDQILVRLPTDEEENASLAPILFDLGDLIA